MTKSTCLLCDKPIQQRGLCTTHYQRFVRAKASIPEEKHTEFEQGLIKKGLLAAPQLPGPKVERDEFAEFAKDLVANSPQDHYRATKNERDVDATAEALIGKARERTKKKKSVDDKKKAKNKE